MRYLLVAAAALLPFHPVLAQEANQNEMQAITEIAQCKETEDRLEPFTPCDTDLPASILVGLRGVQSAERRGWTSARLVVERDGSFRLNYDFPK